MVSQSVLLRPLTSCCCFSIPLGTVIILAAHLLWCLLTLIALSVEVIGGNQLIDLGLSLEASVFLGMFQLVGVTIIVGALYGWYTKLNTCVRIYLCYALAAFVVSSLLLIRRLFFIHGRCGLIYSSAATDQSGIWDDGVAMRCGWTRLVQWAIMILATAAQVFCMWVVWSYLQESSIFPGREAIPGLITGTTEKPEWVLRPLTNFFCFTVSVGTVMIMTAHLLWCLLSLIILVGDVVGGHQLVDIGLSMEASVFFGMFQLAGVVIILGGLYGWYNNLHTCVRIYLWYAIVTLFVSSVALIHLLFLVSGPCGVLYESSTSDTSGIWDDGVALRCGWTRLAQCAITTLSTLGQVGCLWVVWSYMQDVTTCPGSDALPSLMSSLEKAERIFQKSLRKDGPYAGIVGFAHSDLPTAYPAIDYYGATHH